MPIYEFRCPDCTIHTELFAPNPPAPPICPHCLTPTSRVFSFNSTPIMQETFVPAVGMNVHSMHQLREHGKRLSEEHHLRTGLDHNYVPADYRDKEALGVTNEGLYEQAKAWRDKGRTDVANRIEKAM